MKNLLKWSQSLLIRLSIIIVLLLVISNITLLYFSQHYAKLAAKESMQSMHIGMASYILSHQEKPLINDEGEVNKALMQDLMMHIMAINPATEVYLLNAEGRILGHVLEGVDPNELIGNKVDLTSIASLLDGNKIPKRLPVLGSDPRRLEEGNIISVAPIFSNNKIKKLGYLYIVLDGKNKQILSNSVENSVALQTLWLGMLIATIAGGFVLWVILFKLINPLKELTENVQTMRLDEGAQLIDSQQIQNGQHNEINVLKSAIDLLKLRVNEQFKRIQENDQMRRELMSNISHDLRTPLASTQGYVETLLIQKEEISNDLRNEYLGIALRQLKRMDKHVLELFEFAKLDSGRIIPKHEIFCMGELLSDVIQGYQLQASQANIRLHQQINERVNVNADIALIERVLQNLLENAIRYTSAGGKIDVELKVTEQQVHISIKDNGIGISDQHLPHIFERYWRAFETEPQNQSGAGLGLAIVKRILDLHNIAIQVHSILNQGTQFTFKLPEAHFSN